ncbi:glycerol dehydrogenase [Gloeophyllum trabeum ATCC 11539]|uniref:Glycerol dehydrogenase n=1 Tax=Gloeophyllum trabeum (strain ATCC 11539 / FP-39264 / Madison 617) TaxID=670483 RepID=S7S533_GLOTA|nr:glycerol dehydrogenase [Gloeophyllum trabeum ATCC 11539]EPQ61039.1 glycerol dehydrogenase [Gloeophyllum trabeum ATCC 11539]
MPNPEKITEKVFQSPSKYIQGPSALKNAARYLSPLGQRPLVVVDNIVFEIAGKTLLSALSTAGMNPTRGAFTGEASLQEIGRLADIAKSSNPPCDFIIALGGGKTIDTSKQIATDLHLPVAVLPTTASTDAPCSALSVLYTPEGEFHKYSFFEKNPNIVLVDTSIVVKAPARFLAAGIGDALATNVEAREVRNSPNFGKGLPTAVSVAICSKCEEILFQYGQQALEANKAQALTPAFEAVVEANTLLSGLGFESGGLAAAHAIHDGLTSLPELHHLMHGEKVNFGTVCQLLLSNTPAETLDRYLKLMVSVGLPVTFEQLGLKEVRDEDLRKVARLACSPGETIWNLDVVINEDVAYGLLKAADAVGREYLARTSKA